jgi:hypothetical protein
MPAADGDRELAALLAEGWHVVSYLEGDATSPARIRARRRDRP